MQTITQNIEIIIAVLGFGITIFTLRKGRKDLGISNIIELQKLLIEYSDIHTKLLPEGEWSNSQIEFKMSLDEFSKFNSYCGVFEIAKLMLDNNSLSKEEFLIFFEYRLSNLKNNKNAMKSIDENNESWKNLIELMKSIK